MLEGNHLSKFITQLCNKLDTTLDNYKRTFEIAKKLSDASKGRGDRINKMDQYKESNTTTRKDI